MCGGGGQVQQAKVVIISVPSFYVTGAEGDEDSCD